MKFTLSATIVALTFVCLFVYPTHGDESYTGVTVSTRTPYGAKPPVCNKPSAVYMEEIRKVIVAFGYVDNCTSQTTTYNPTDQVYAYDPFTNVGYNIPASGDLPPPAAFVTCFQSGDTQMTCFSGVFYSFFFDVIDIKNLSTIYILDVDWEEREAYWTAVEASGDIPDPRVELTHVDHPYDDDIVLIYGGVFFNTTSFIFQSVGQIYSYSKCRQRFTLLHEQGLYDNGTDANVPQSRYHAHGFHAMIAGNPVVQISQGVHRHSSIEDSTDVLDYWQFDLEDNEWTELFPDPQIGLTGNEEDPERRHDVQFQFKKHSKEYQCLFTGDKAHDSPIHTLGCIFDVDTVDNAQCNNPKDNMKQGSWLPVNFDGTLQRAKYPATVVVGSKAFYFSGVREEPFNETYNIQVFNTKIGVIDFKNFKKDHSWWSRSVSEPFALPKQKSTTMNSSNSPFIDMELARQRIVAMGRPDPMSVFKASN